MVDDIVRNWILDGIESGGISAGGKLPGAREIAARCGISFLMAQRAIASLVQDGVLTCIPRRGAFVKPGWEERLIANHLVLFSNTREWVPKLRERMRAELPELRLCSGFKRGMFEVRTTYTLQRDRNQYMDLAPILNRCFFGREEFYEHPFQGFRESDGRLFGIPFDFSPRVLFCNTRLLKYYRIPLPAEGWEWGEFLEIIRRLRRDLSDIEILNYTESPYWWMNIFFRAGGRLLEREAGRTCRFFLNTPESIRALHALRELYQALRPERREEGNAQRFSSGSQLFSIADRNYISAIRADGLTDWCTLPLPRIPGGKPLTAQATDLICIRKECTDDSTAEAFIRFMLSESVQDILGSSKNGIPILRKAAEKSFADGDERDAVFKKEMFHVTSDYNIDSSGITEIIYYRIVKLIRESMPLEEAIAEFSRAVDLILTTSNEMCKDAMWS